jgi:type IV secretion system protein VirB10
MADSKNQAPQGIKAPNAAAGTPIETNPKTRSATKMRNEIRVGAIALGAIILLAIVMGIMRHSAKQQAAATPQATTDKSVRSAGTGADKFTSSLEEKARRDKAKSGYGSSDTMLPTGTPADDVGNELNVPPTRIAQNGQGQPTGPHQPTPAELRLQREATEYQAALNSSLSKGGSAGMHASAAPAPPPSPAEALAQLARGWQANQAGAPSNGGPGAGAPDQNRQDDKIGFLDKARQPSNDANFARVERVASISRYEVKAGWDIPATLEQGMNSDLPGDVRGIVRENVYDTVTGKYLVIPQGSRVIGSYNSRITYGQRGLQVIWTRLTFPDGSSIDLGGLNGEDVRGLSGFRDKVNNHYGKLFAIAALTSVFAAGVELSQRQNGGNVYTGTPTVNQTISASVGQQIGQLGTTLAERQLNVQPTVTIPIGYRFNIRVRKDLIFDAPYADRQAVWK